MKKVKQDLYDWDIYFCLNRKEYNKIMKKMQQEEDNSLRWDGIHSYFTYNNRYTSIIAIDSDLVKDYSKDYKLELKSILIHEITHAMQYITGSLNLRCDENEANIVQFLYKKFMPELEKYLEGEK